MPLSTPELDRLCRVDIRSIWQHEALGFTPWLASQENIDLLSETLGIPLEVSDIEVGVGPYSADIVCKDAITGRAIVIENQLEQTDHGHLGQTITYAAGLDAAAVVWIAPRFTEQHRAAFDWLNRISSEEFSFFGVQLELWRIGSSKPAVRFELISKPNEWTRAAHSSTSATSATQNEWERYWSEFCIYAEPILKRRLRPRRSRFAYISSAHPAARWYVHFNERKREVDVELVVDGPGWQDAFTQISSLFRGSTGLPGEYREQLNRKSAVIGFILSNTDATNSPERPSQFEWLVNAVNSLTGRFDAQIRLIRSSTSSLSGDAPQSDGSNPSYIETDPVDDFESASMG